MSRFVFFAVLLCSIASSPPGRARDADSPDDLIERVTSTLAYRYELAAQLADRNRMDEAEDALRELMALHESVDPLAAQIWLRMAASREARADIPEARALYAEIQDRFSHIPWALVESEGALERLGRADEADPKRDPFRPREQSFSAIAAGDRIIHLELEECTLARLRSFFDEVLGVRLEIDPALADRRIDITAGRIAIRAVLDRVAAQTDAEVIRTGDGYRLTARPSRAQADSGLDGPLAIRGELDREAVQRVVRARWPRLASCYRDRPAGADPTIRLRLAFSINPAGEVEAARVLVQASSPTSELVRQCVRAVVSDWRFPRPRSGTVEVQQEIQFRTARR
ncbi:MAG: AgmX/PglI C-terminal domain-containing protein [Deltaproteobacteria bacterium]|nr:AgmX/PglI C-terminal domain-containing protein [Deltaproteobacteria bacterium]